MEFLRKYSPLFTFGILAIAIVALIIGQFRDIKNEFKDVRAEIKDVRTELKADIAQVRTEIKDVRAELKAEIAQVRTELKEEIKAIGHKLDTLILTISHQKQAHHSISPKRQPSSHHHK